MTPTPFDHILFAILAVVFPLWASRFGFRRLRLATRADLPRVRRAVYRSGMALQWSLTALVLALWLVREGAWVSLGVVPLPTLGLAGVAVGTVIVVVYVLRQRREALEDDDTLAEVRLKMERLEPMLPRSTSELHAFFRLSITAGICEEILYRGFLIWYLSNWFGPLPAAGLAAVLFGFGHSYQGVRGILLTTAVGAFFGATYLVSGSLVAPMILHTLMDMHSGHLAMVAFNREDERLARLAAERAAEERALAEERRQAEERALAEAHARAQSTDPVGDGEQA